MTDLPDTADAVHANPDRPPVYEVNGRAFYRASSLSLCTKALVAIRLGFQTMSPPPFMQVKFQEGHDAEPKILRMVERDHGVRISTMQEPIAPIEVGTSLITGTMDALGAHDFHGACVIEAKAFAQSTWDKWHAQHWDAFPYYAWQVAIYHHATEGLPVAFSVYNKETGELDVTWVTEPLVSLAKIKAKVATVEALAKKGDPPESCDSKSWPCPTYYLCDQREVVLALGDARLNALATEFKAADEDLKRVKAVREKARELLLEAVGPDKKVTGDWTITPSEVTNAGGVDYDRFAADHPDIDLGEYRRRSTSTRLTVRARTKGDEI